jgi:tol-pal system protein YbgF
VAAVPPRTSAQGGFDPVVPSEPPVAAAPARPAGSDQQNYQAAFDLIQARRYEEAGRAFTEFLQAFPDSPLADNAQYWLAETHYVQRSFTTALPEFQKVIDNYPQSAKMPDALLKIGYCQHELGDLDSARATLQRVMRQFPDTTAARLAAQRLDRIG